MTSNVRCLTQSELGDVLAVFKRLEPRPSDPISAFLAVETRRVCARMIAAEALDNPDPPWSMIRDINAILREHPDWRCLGKQRCGIYGRNTSYERID